MRPLTLVVAAASLFASGCGYSFFNGDYQDGYQCCADGTCPPGQDCIAGENICRWPCSVPGPCQSGQSCECNDHQNNNSGSNFTEVCDVDLHCRQSCSGNPGQNGCNNANCNFGEICDSTTSVCHPPCGANNTCPPGGMCVVEGTCGLCEPAHVNGVDGGVMKTATIYFAPPSIHTPPSINDLVTDSNQVIWGDAEGAVYACGAGLTCPGGGAVTTVANGGPPVESLATSNGTVLWSTTSNMSPLFICPIMGCSAPQSIPKSLPDSTSPVALSGSDLYWVETGNIRHCDASQMPLCASPDLIYMGSPGGLIGGMVLFQGSQLLFTTPNALMTCPLPGLPTSCAGLAGGPNPGPLAVDTGGDVFWAQNMSLERCSLGANPPCMGNGGATSIGTDTSAALGHGIATDGKFVYWLDQATSTVWQYNLSNPIPVQIATKQGNLRSIAIDTNSGRVYWTSDAVMMVFQP